MRTVLGKARVRDGTAMAISHISLIIRTRLDSQECFVALLVRARTFASARQLQIRYRLLGCDLGLEPSLCQKPRLSITQPRKSAFFLRHPWEFAFEHSDDEEPLPLLRHAKHRALHDIGIDVVSLRKTPNEFFAEVASQRAIAVDEIRGDAPDILD